MGVRQDIFSTVKSALISASLTASDIQNSSINVTIKGEYNDNKDKRSLPVVTISKVSLPSSNSIAFGEGYLSHRTPRIMLDIYGQRIQHVEMIADQIDDYLRNNKIGYSIISVEEDNELTTPSSQTAHHKTLYYTFSYWDR